ncbi:MAG: glutamate--tRNA ligase [Phycisphaerae bacterium]
MQPLTTRFAPSPTGHLHVGSARTALFAYLLARKTGGTFVVRIEDTDRSRHIEEAVDMIVQDLRWLGLEWDEGIEVGGANGPYRQSERLELYARYIETLLEDGKAYYAFDTPEQLDAMRGKARAEKKDFLYPRPETFPSVAEAQAAREADKPVVVRFACPDRDVTVQDDAFGEVTTPAAVLDDFVIQKADGYPTFYLANVVDDALMGINYITRGQEFLGQSWRQTLLREALGFEEPGCCHLPLIMDMQGRKLSKRDGDVDVGSFRAAGYLPETLVNFVALLGWNPGGDQEKMSLEQLVELFSVERIGKTNAKFDRDKLLAFNTDALAAAQTDRLVAGFRDYLSLNESHIPVSDDALLGRIVDCNRGYKTFADLKDKVDVLFGPDDAFAYVDKAVTKVLAKNDGQGYEVLEKLIEPLGRVEWTGQALHEMIESFCEANELGMGKVAQPLRVALTGNTVSPPITDTLEFVGREACLARIRRCLARR